MADLRGKKSCHTGFGRNVGYKIPITRLKKNGVLKISSDPTLSSVEKELKALSDFFASACIVGSYSADQEINRNLSMKICCVLCGRSSFDPPMNDLFLQNRSIRTYVRCARILLNATIRTNIPVTMDRSNVWSKTVAMSHSRKSFTFVDSLA